MCWDILRNPVAAIARARQKKDTNATIIKLLEISAIFAAAATIITARAAANTALVIGALLSSFSVFVIFAAVLGWVVKIAAVNLGGRGDYHEGFTAVTYALAPFAAGLLAISLLAYVPVIGGFLSFLVVFPMLASALSILYRAVKDLYRTDMVTSLVTVSITTTVLVLALVFLSSSAMRLMML